MGSGCTNTNNGCVNPISANCVIYQGDPIPVLGICKGDNLSEIQEVIINRLLALVDGTGITLSSINTTCDFISNQLAGKDKTLFNLIQVLVTSNCTLNELITNLTAQVNATVTYDNKCVTPTTSGTQGTVQGIIDKLCELNTTVTEITNDLGTTTITTSITTIAGNTLINNIKSGYGVRKTGSGASAQVEFYAFVPPFCPIPCVASLSNFDSNGIGITGSPYEGFFVCNGLNSVPDMRGFVFGGATNLPGINGPALQSSVDPTINNDLTYSSNMGDRKGLVKVGLNVNEGPSHFHTGTTNPHTHNISPMQASFGAAGSPAQTVESYVNDGGSVTTSSVSVGFTTNSSGQGTPHENRQPTFYGYWIMRKN